MLQYTNPLVWITTVTHFFLLRFASLKFLSPKGRKGGGNPRMASWWNHLIRSIYSAHALCFVLCHIPSSVCDKQSVATRPTIKLLADVSVGNKISSYPTHKLQDVANFGIRSGMKTYESTTAAEQEIKCELETKLCCCFFKDGEEWCMTEFGQLWKVVEPLINNAWKNHTIEEV